MITQPTIKNIMSRVAINIIRSNITATQSLLGSEVSIFNPQEESSIYSNENKNFVYKDEHDLRELFIVTGFNFYLKGNNPKYSGYSNDGNETILWEFDNFNRIKENAKVVVNHVSAERHYVATNPDIFVDYNGLVGFIKWRLIPLSLDMINSSTPIEKLSDSTDTSNSEAVNNYDTMNDEILFKMIDEDDEMYGV